MLHTSSADFGGILNGDTEFSQLLMLVNFGANTVANDKVKVTLAFPTGASLADFDQEGIRAFSSTSGSNIV